MKTYFLSFLFLPFILSAQFNWPSLSPPGKVVQEVGNTTVTVTYERPSARNREIYGGLVPWNKLWRTGAGYCTKVDLNRDVLVGGQSLPAGKYALLTIPRPDRWTIIFNRDTTLYSGRNYDVDKDAARFTVVPEKSHRFYETLTIDLDLRPNDAELYISWTDVMVHFPVETTTDAEAMAYIEHTLLPDELGMAVEYLQYQNKDTELAFQLVGRLLTEDPLSGWGWRLKAELLEKKGLYNEAAKSIDEAIAIRKANPLSEPREQAWDLAYWEKMKEDLWGRAGFTTTTIRYGEGPIVGEKDTVLIHERFFVEDSKTPYFSTWKRGGPIRVHLGQNQIITGLEMGLVGMQVGERRHMTIPPELSQRTEYPFGLHPQNTLHYEVEVVDIIRSEE